MHLLRKTVRVLVRCGSHRIHLQRLFTAGLFTSNRKSWVASGDEGVASGGVDFKGYNAPELLPLLSDAFQDHLVFSELGSCRALLNSRSSDPAWQERHDRVDFGRASKGVQQLVMPDGQLEC